MSWGACESLDKLSTARWRHPCLKNACQRRNPDLLERSSGSVSVITRSTVHGRRPAADGHSTADRAGHSSRGWRWRLLQWPARPQAMTRGFVLSAFIIGLALLAGQHLLDRADHDPRLARDGPVTCRCPGCCRPWRCDSRGPRAFHYSSLPVIVVGWERLQGFPNGRLLLAAPRAQPV